MSDTTSSYTADSRLAMLIKAAEDTGEPLRVHVGETTYELQVKSVTKSGDLWAGYDPNAARKAWRESSGVLKGVDADALIKRLREEREQDSSGRSWPT